MRSGPLLDRMSDRVALEKEEGDVAYFHALSLQLEYLTKLVCAGVVACLGEDADRHRYGLEHRLVRANSIGEWVDTDGDGRYDELRVETRNFRGPRVFDPSGIPLAKDNETVVRVRFFVDKQNPDMLHDEITTIDHALTEPWTVVKTYRRERNAIFSEAYCAVDNPHVKIGGENYMLDPHGVLMPTKKGQKPPDLKYFK